MATATLKMTREGFGIELRRGTFEVTVDGTNVGSVHYSETIEAPVTPGHHTLRVRAGRYSSRDLAFDVKDGDVVSFRCHGAMVWPRFVASLVVPGLAISVRRA